MLLAALFLLGRGGLPSLMLLIVVNFHGMVLWSPLACRQRHIDPHQCYCESGHFVLKNYRIRGPVRAAVSVLMKFETW